MLVNRRGAKISIYQWANGELNRTTLACVDRYSVSERISFPVLNLLDFYLTLCAFVVVKVSQSTTNLK